MKWEYKVIKADVISKFSEMEELQEELNNYGKEGWELVNFVYPPQMGTGWESKENIDSVIFKREIIAK